MNKLLFFALVLICASCAQQTQNNVMCHDPKAEFAHFADDADFRAAHPAPLPVTVDYAGKMIRYAVPGADSANAYLVKAKTKTDKYLLLFHEWWGLNDYIKMEADKWSKELNINVLALDLYDGKVADKPEDAGKYMQANDATRSEAIITAAGKYAGEKADFRTMGWCFGGGWSFKAALLLKEKTKACVMYYGMPDKDPDALKTLASDVLFIYGKKDRWITQEVAADFQKNMKAAGKTVDVHAYDADHAFANPSSPRYDEQAAKDAREVATAYLKKHS